MILPHFYIDDLIKTALKEDINYIDVTTDLLFGENENKTASGYFIAKADGVLAGIDVAERVFMLISEDVRVKKHFRDGGAIKCGDVIADFSGNAAALLKAERTALNFIQHMSGIATYTANCVNAVSGTGAKICDTRKTLPGLRSLQKYSVLCGGGFNHRFNLSDGVMIKDNHIDAFGGIAPAVAEIRKRLGHMVKIEVETRNLEEVEAAIASGAEVIMLDNMDESSIKAAVALREKMRSNALFEISGNVTLENIAGKAAAGADLISLGALTHSVTAFDISMKINLGNDRACTC
ncbi:nicotinate-nucleotide diphosphorylase (carboxylating) [Clostridia bacterium]|nr:nicotinate-nucleotide diphosphorylase (carboxylating) [Clostridia bacterium]